MHSICEGIIFLVRMVRKNIPKEYVAGNSLQGVANLCRGSFLNWFPNSRFLKRADAQRLAVLFDVYFVNKGDACPTPTSPTEITPDPKINLLKLEASFNH